MRKEITIAFTTQARHTFIGQPEQATILRFRRNSQYEFAPVRNGYRNLASEHCCDQVDIYIDIKVIALTFVKLIRFDADNEKEVTARATTAAWLPFACYTNPGTSLNSC